MLVDSVGIVRDCRDRLPAHTLGYQVHTSPKWHSFKNHQAQTKTKNPILTASHFLRQLQANNWNPLPTIQYNVCSRTTAPPFTANARPCATLQFQKMFSKLAPRDHAELFCRVEPPRRASLILLIVTKLFLLKRRARLFGKHGSGGGGGGIQCRI